MMTTKDRIPRRSRNYPETLPYGKWMCPDGREVLFNRHYAPIRQRGADGIVSEADGSEWVRFVHQEWFYNDRNPVPMDSDTVTRCIDMLKSWGVA